MDLGKILRANSIDEEFEFCNRSDRHIIRPASFSTSIPPPVTDPVFVHHHRRWQREEDGPAGSEGEGNEVCAEPFPSSPKPLLRNTWS
ncbi:hypothetical protein ACFX2I_014787 [Malus domestica]